MAMKDPLAKLFGSVGRVKIMRLFFAKPDEPLTQADIVRQSKTIKTTVQKEASLLLSIGFILAKKEGKVLMYTLNKDFEFLQPLRVLLTQVTKEQSEALTKRVRKVGRIKGLFISGVFLRESEAVVDIVIIGDALKQRQLESAIIATEAELGQELRYCAFGTSEFTYRKNMNDKLVSDILQSSHKKLINTLKV